MSTQLPATNHWQTTWQQRQGADLFNPQALALESAQEFMRSYTQVFRDQLQSQTILLEKALGRVLSHPIIANMNVPTANNSAMDGYAFHSEALLQGSKVRLCVIAKQFAGQSLTPSMASHFEKNRHAVRIMTGALIPPHCDTVVPQEWVTALDDQIEFDSQRISAGDNQRLKGEDLRLGDTVLSQGRILRASDLGLIASMGFANVQVFQKMTIAYFSTGDEVTAVGEPLEDGSLYDSNRFTLLGMLSRMGFDLIDLGIVRDQPEALKQVFLQAASRADVIITSGGVSVGEADFTKSIMRELGDVAFWTLAIKPGRPMAFGKINSPNNEAVLFGLPGNPVAVMVTFYQLVRDALCYMSGANDYSPPLMQAKLKGDFKKRPGRTEFLRGALFRDEHQDLWVKPNGHQGSGILRSMSEADCLIVLSANVAQINHGESVDISVLNGLI